MTRTKKDLVTAEVHRKAGPFKKKKEEKTCPPCKGTGEIFDAGHMYECTLCGGEGVVYKGQKYHAVYNDVWPFKE